MANEKRLIDANALKEYINSIEASGGHKYYRQGMDDTLHFHLPHIIDDQPKVDAVEVVRCKDCKHFYHSVSSDRDGRCVQFGTYDTDPSVYLNDFCSYGERRTDG